MVDGVEVMQLIGWDKSYWKLPIPPSTDHYLCMSMAGNAFPGPIVCAHFAAAMSAYGTSAITNIGM